MFNTDNFSHISSFLIGTSTAFYAIFSIFILFYRKENTRLQSVLGIILAVWAVWNLKDIVLTFPNMYVSEVLNWITIIDGWSAITYTVFVFEVTMPGWTTPRRLVLIGLPFAVFSIVFALWPVEVVIYAYVIFLWFYAWGVIIFGYISVTKYLRYIRCNYSNPKIRNYHPIHD